MRISDWSSDVCSSDLVQQHLDEHQQAEVEPLRVEPHPESEDVAVLLQSLQPLAGGRRGQPDLVGEVNRSDRSEEHTSELQSLMRISYAVFCLKKKNTTNEQSYNEADKTNEYACQKRT